ncbi:ASPHD1, partial [Symbiodinium sp. CCMP2456]
RNFFLTAHFGLSVPPDCSITVGGDERPWKEDDCIVLDTSFLHSTKNESDEDRFVLVVDFWHPDLTVPERE